MTLKCMLLCVVFFACGYFLAKFTIPPKTVTVVKCVNYI